MNVDLWLSFVAVTIAAVLSPGPAVLLALTHGGMNGARGAFFAIMGNETGLVILIAISIVGIGAVLENSSQIITYLRIFGGLYLVYLGLRLIFVKQKISTSDASSEIKPAKVFSARKSYFQGIGVAISNPKALLLIGALFPQFLDISRPVWSQLVIMGVTLLVLSFSALMGYAIIADKARTKTGSALAGKMSKVSGGLFILFGIALAADLR